jgi:hypothetical protein
MTTKRIKVHWQPAFWNPRAGPMTSAIPSFIEVEDVRARRWNLFRNFVGAKDVLQWNSVSNALGK